MQRRRSKNIIIMLVNSVKLNSPSFQKINHLHVQVLFKRTVCTKSKNIQTVDKNSWQLPKIKSIMQKQVQSRLWLKTHAHVFENNVELVQKSSIPKSSSNSFALQKTLLQMNFSSKNILLLHQVDEKHSHAHKRIFTVL